MEITKANNKLHCWKMRKLIRFSKPEKKNDTKKRKERQKVKYYQIHIIPEAMNSRKILKYSIIFEFEQSKIKKQSTEEET